jgi:hypothetical protein
MPTGGGKKMNFDVVVVVDFVLLSRFLDNQAGG